MTAFEKVCEALLIHRDASVYDQARAVLAALREPTEEMIQAALDAAVDEDRQHDSTPDQYWRSMIDAAATEPKT